MILCVYSELAYLEEVGQGLGQGGLPPVQQRPQGGVDTRRGGCRGDAGALRLGLGLQEGGVQILRSGTIHPSTHTTLCVQPLYHNDDATVIIISGCSVSPAQSKGSGFDPQSLTSEHLLAPSGHLISLN